MLAYESEYNIHHQKMNLGPHLSFGRISKFVKIFIFLVVASSLVGCRPPDTVSTSITPLVEVQILTPSPLTETPVPACVVLSDVELSVELLSDENSIHIRITGLVPNEMVHAIFSSQIKGQTRETTVSGFADEKGVFEYAKGLRGQNIDREFKDWQIRVVHSRGSTCTEFVFP